MRNTKWQNDQVYNALKDRNTGWCITDNPALKTLSKLEYIQTSDIAYIRFHGRNAQNWYTGNNVSRYDYLYTDTELQEIKKNNENNRKRRITGNSSAALKGGSGVPVG